MEKYCLGSKLYAIYSSVTMSSKQRLPDALNAGKFLCKMHFYIAEGNRSLDLLITNCTAINR